MNEPEREAENDLDAIDEAPERLTRRERLFRAQSGRIDRQRKLRKIKDERREARRWAAYNRDPKGGD